jgi:hypothetical protein
MGWRSRRSTVSMPGGLKRISRRWYRPHFRPHFHDPWTNLDQADARDTFCSYNVRMLEC